MADSLTRQTAQDKDRNDKVISPIHCGVELFIQRGTVTNWNLYSIIIALKSELMLWGNVVVCFLEELALSFIVNRPNQHRDPKL